MKDNRVEHITIQKIGNENIIEQEDLVAVEEPLGIILEFSTGSGRMQKNIAVTMRTPGNDEELAAGFLFTEGIIKDAHYIHDIKHIASDDNRVLVTLRQDIIPSLKNTDRNFYTTSSCGICGKASIDAIRTSSVYTDQPGDIAVRASLLYHLQDALKEQQEVFENTGGIHASALFTTDAAFVMLREDVGRHNALDKVIGAALLEKKLPLNEHILFLSGRASFELIQKASMAGIKIVVAVGAASSLAVELAKELNITLAGFLRNDRFNIYSAYKRIIV